MSPKCIMNCKEFSQLFDFPTDAQEMENWCTILGLDSDTIYDNDKLCERHFHPKFVDEEMLTTDAFPEIPSISQSYGGNTKEATDEDNCSVEFETIYLTLERPSKRPAVKTYKKVSRTEKKTKIRAKDDDLQLAEESPNISRVSAASKAGFEPVKISFESPPKRTYAHGATGKTPQLDITTTCYCRCHKGEEEEQRQLVISMKAMTKQVEEQSQEIQSLMSQNKISEHLLKTKMKRIADLVSLEQNLRKEVETLNKRLSDMDRRQIMADVNASENSITFARMVCHKRKKYTRAEVLLAQKIYSVSGRCYCFMRGVLMLNLPHTTTLKRQRQLKADSYLAQAVPISASESELDIEEEHLC